MALNPAALPTHFVPLGFEGSFESRTPPDKKAGFTASLLEGFNGFGFGLATWTEGAFNEPDLGYHFFGSADDAVYRQINMTSPTTTGGRLSAAVSFPKFLLPRGVLLSVGGALEGGHVNGVTTGIFGVNLDVLGISIGYDRSRDELSPLLPQVTVSNLSFGTQINQFYLGYLHQSLVSTVSETSAALAMLRWTGGAWAAWLGAKWQGSTKSGADQWTRGGLQWRAGSHLGLSYEYGHYRYSHGLVAQIYL